MMRTAIVTGTLGAALTMARPLGVQSAPRLALELQDYASLPITADNTNDNTRAQLARVNFLRDEPGGRRFFVNDLNGPLYILDKRTKAVTTYLDFNGAGGRPGLFQKLTFERNFATGLTNFLFDPDYARNGVFYTLHMEDPAVAAPAIPKSGVVAGLDLTGYTTTPALPTPTVDGRIEREVVLIEWTDRNPSNGTFEGTARELLRLQHPTPIHPLGEMTFNPTARPGDADWRVMYLGAGDAGSGEQRDSRRLNPQRLDTFAGKILRIIPDLREHTATSTVSENGRYRIPNDNPFATVDGARKEIWAYGLRNPHRLLWDVDPARPRTPTLLAFNIGLVTWETVVIVHKGSNYGYPLREGTQSMSSTNGMGPLPERDIIPVQISDTVVRGEVKPTYPVIQYRHTRETGGDAIANGFVYRGKRIPLLRDKLVFGDITTGRIWYANRSDVLAADDGNPTTVAPMFEMDVGLRRLTEETYRKRGGKGETLPGFSAIAGRGRVDLRFAMDDEGELYILTKSDGMIRKVVGAKVATTAPPSAANVPARGPGQSVSSSSAAVLKNPVASTPASIAAGKRVYDANCAACHGNRGQGAVKAGTTISIIEEQRGKQPPDLTDDQWDHGSSDGAIFGVIKRGLPSTMMAGFDERIPDQEIWRIVNYLRSLRPRTPAPLVIQAQGSFAVGGTVVTTPGTFDPTAQGAYTPTPDPKGQTLHGDHAYVFYQVPVNARRLPLIFWHGHGQSAKTWETTPDGREGFQTIFLRRGYPVYLLDQPRRGRAARSTAPVTIPATPDEQMWFGVFRLGVWPALYPGVQFSWDSSALNQFFRQSVPNTGPYDVEVNTSAVAALFEKIGPGILVTHSQSGTLGWRTAIKSRNIRAIVSYEPGGDFLFPEGEAPSLPFGARTFTPPTIPMSDFVQLTKVPIVVYYGDNIPEQPSTNPGQEQWRAFLSVARRWRDVVNRHGGDVTLVELPSIGIRGNTHFPMSDLNNVEVANHLSEFLRKKGLD